MNLQVQVGSGRVAIASDLADHVTHLDLIAHINEDTIRVHVDVPGLHLLAVDLVLDDDKHPRAPFLAGTGVNHLAVGNGVDRCPGGGRKV